MVRRLKPLPIEAVVRGYLIGSGWKDYQRDWRRVRHRAAAGAAAGGVPAATHFHAGDQGRRRRAMTRTSTSPASSGCSAPTLAAQRPRYRACGCTREARTTPGSARHHHRRHQVRVRAGRRRHALPDRRGADAGLLALLASRRVPRGNQPAELRQAVRARLPRDAGLGQASARSIAAGRDHRQDKRQVP